MLREGLKGSSDGVYLAARNARDPARAGSLNGLLSCSARIRENRQSPVPAFIRVKRGPALGHHQKPTAPQLSFRSAPRAVVRLWRPVGADERLFGDLELDGPVFFWITVPRSRTLPPAHMSSTIAEQG